MLYKIALHFVWVVARGDSERGREGVRERESEVTSEFHTKDKANSLYSVCMCMSNICGSFTDKAITVSVVNITCMKRHGAIHGLSLIHI